MKDKALEVFQRQKEYVKNLKYGYYDDGKVALLKSIFNTLYSEYEQVLQSNELTLEELKQSIIDRLNEYYKEVFVFDSIKSFRSSSYSVIFYSGTIWFKKFIPLDLAHDITKFFIYSEEVKR